jgi:tetratricopeptide (TPR) repeat protein
MICYTSDMNERVGNVMPLRTVILGTLVVCVLVAVAPWWSGGQEPLAMMLAGGALLLGALLVWRQPEARRLKRGPLVWVWGAFMGFALLSLAWSANRYTSAVWVVQWLMAGAAFWLAYVVAGEERGRTWLVRGYLASAGVFAAAAIWMYLTGSYDRLTGSFYWPNPAAAYLMPALLLCMDEWRRGLNKKAYWWVVLTVILTAAFLLTDSRAAILVMVLVTVLYLVVVPTPRRFWIKFVFILALGIGLSFGLAGLSKLVAHHSTKIVPGSRLAEAATGESKSLKDRLYYLGSAFEIWFAHPVGGTGAGTYGDVHPQYQQRVVSASTNAHNIYAQVLAELGFVGAVLLAGVLLWLVLGVARGFAVEPGVLAVMLGAAALLLHFGLDIDAHYPSLLMLVAVLLGLVFRQHGSQRGTASWRPVAVAAILLVPVVGWYQGDVWAKRAQADQRDGDYEQAAEHFGLAQRGLVVDPDYVNAEGINLYALGLSAGKGGKVPLDVALDRAREAEALDPHDGQHHQLEGRVLAAEGNMKAAQAALREALKLDPLNHPGYALDLASMQLAAGDTPGAVKTAQAMLELYPDEVIDNRSSDETVRPAAADLEALVGNVDLQAGRLEAARAAARRALKVYPGSLRARALQHQVDLAGQPQV